MSGLADLQISFGSNLNSFNATAFLTPELFPARVGSMEMLPASLPPSPLQKSRHKELVVTKRHDEILQAVHKLRYVTAWDMTRLFYTPSSINHVREILSL